MWCDLKDDLNLLVGVLGCARRALNAKVKVRIFNEQQMNSNKQAKQKYYCPDCGREISKNATRCLSCASKFRGQTKFNLSKEELQSLLDQGYSRIQIGKKFGITEAAIRK